MSKKPISRSSKQANTENLCLKNRIEDKNYLTY